MIGYFMLAALFIGMFIVSGYVDGWGITAIAFLITIGLLVYVIIAVNLIDKS